MQEEEKYSLESQYHIYNNKTGDKLIVRPDADCGGELAELVYIDRDGQEIGRITDFPEKMLLAAKALMALCEELIEKKNSRP
jgi:hypothetical protein